MTKYIDLTTCNPSTPTEQQFSNTKPANLEQIVKTVEPQPIKTVKPPQLEKAMEPPKPAKTVEKTMEPPKPAKTVEPQPPAKTVESAKAKICAKNNLSNLDMIPLGKILKYLNISHFCKLVSKVQVQEYNLDQMFGAYLTSSLRD